MSQRTRNEQIEATAASFLARRERCKWSDTDEAEFVAWLNISTANRVAYIRLEAAWKQADRLKALAATPRPKQPQCSPHQEIFTRLRWRSVAASLVLGIGIYIGWFLSNSEISTYQTPVGGMEIITLADRSKVTLNTGTKINVRISDRERYIKLEHGEAFFEVFPDSLRPFVVQAGKQRVVAVGTKFSIRREPAALQVLVTEGLVRVEQKMKLTGHVNDVEKDLQAGTLARIVPTDTDVLIQEVSEEQITAALSWQSGFLSFTDTPLEEAVSEFNRYNLRKFVIKDSNIAGIRISGQFRSTNLEAFARLLQSGLGINIQRKSDEFVLQGR